MSQNTYDKKKPLFKKWWFWLILILVVGALASNGRSSRQSERVNSQSPAVESSPEGRNMQSDEGQLRTEEPTQNEPEQTDEPMRNEDTATERTEDAEQPEKPTSDDSEEDNAVDIPESPEPEPEETVTTGEKNALSQAKNYLSFMPFSYKGLVEQLEFEGYTEEEATYAVDNCGADWNEQAAKKAADYLDLMAFSRSGLIEQLEFEGFTHEQAVYGVEQNGY